MWLVPVTFALALAIVYGAYWALVIRPEQQSRQAVARRLGRSSTTEDVRVDLLRDRKRLSAIPALEKTFERA